MTAQKRQYRVVIVSAGDKIRSFLAELLPPDIYDVVSCVSSAGEARRLFTDTQVDIAIINTPLPDDFGTELAMDLSKGTTGVLLMVKYELYEEVCSRVEEHGIFTVSKPCAKQTLCAAIRLVSAVNARLTSMELKNQTLQEKMDDIRIVNRAKWLLIEKRGMTEQQAHYYIEKQAMDLRLSRRAAAMHIIHIFEE